MSRSTKESWLQGPGDLKEADVHDVPVAGQSVRVRGLSAKYSAEVMGQVKFVQQGREQVGKIDIPAMEMLQFAHGCIDPVFTEAEAQEIQQRFGPAFKKVVAKIDELSGIDKEAIEKVEQTFPAGGESETRSDVGAGTPAGSDRSDLPLRISA